MAIYYFGAGGSSGNSGLSFALRKATHAQLIPLLTVGGPHSVYMCANAAGVANRWSNAEQFLPVSGVYYSVFTDHYVRFVVLTSGEQGACHAVSKNTFTIEPGDGFLEFGDPSVWDPFDEISGNYWVDGHQYQARRQLNFLGCTNFKLIGRGTGVPGDPDSNFIVHGGSAWVGNYWDVNCDLYLVEGIDFNRHGTNYWNPNGDYPDVTESADSGDMCVMGGDRSWIVRNRFKWGGHISARFMGRRQVVEDNDLDGDYTGVTPNADAGRGAPIERSGQRCCGCYSGVTSEDEGTYAPPYGPVMYQGNTFRNAGSAGDEHDNNASEINAHHMIIRGNYAWDCCDAVFRGNIFDASFVESPSLIKIYNNSFYGNGRIVEYDHGVGSDNSDIRNDFFNNICDQQKGAYYGYVGARGNQVVRWARGSEQLEGFANYWKGGYWDGNLVSMNATSVANFPDRSPLGTTVSVGYRDDINSINTTTAFAAMDTTYPSEWGAGNVQGSPTYAGNPAGGARTKATFAPNGGLAVGTAVPHATAANTRASPATDLQVGAGQSLRFCDGWGMSSLGFLADKIKIGEGTEVRISSCNYTDGISITLAEARTWTSGDEVCWVREDGTVCEDIGAGQTAGATIPASGVAGYLLLIGYYDTGGNPILIDSAVDVGNVLTHTFTGLVSGRQYYFRIRSYDVAGNISDYTSPRINATTNP